MIIIQVMAEVRRTGRADLITSLCDTKFRLVLLGVTGVGKTFIIDRFVRDEFDASSKVP